MTNVSKLFERDTLTKYPSKLSADKLSHGYFGGRPGSIKPPKVREAKVMLDGLGQDVISRYRTTTGKEFDRYNLGEMTDTVKGMYIEDARFRAALELLCIDPVHAQKITLPWWNDVAANELEHTLQPDGTPSVLIGPRHSYETQLVRHGASIDGFNGIAVGGIIETADGYFVIGLRGGASYPNTYQLHGGALALTEGIIAGHQPIYDAYKSEELTPEMGLSDDRISSACIHSRIFDWATEDAPLYVFLIATEYTLAEMEAAYERNKHQDKAEHTRLVGVKKDPDSVLAFIREKYRGVVSDDRNRGPDRRYLHHSGAIALLSMAEIDDPISILQPLYKPGVW